LVKEHVAEPCADDGTEKQIQEQTREIFERPFFPPVKLSHNLIARKETERKEKPIPPDSQWTELNDLWGHVPHKVMHLKFQGIIL